MVVGLLPTAGVKADSQTYDATDLVIGQELKGGDYISRGEALPEAEIIYCGEDKEPGVLTENGDPIYLEKDYIVADLSYWNEDNTGLGGIYLIPKSYYIISFRDYYDWDDYSDIYISGGMKDQVVEGEVGDSEKLSKNTYYAVGASFKNWELYDDSDENVFTFTDRNDLKAVIDTAKQAGFLYKATLYAAWEKDLDATYTINFDDNLPDDDYVSTSNPAIAPTQPLTGNIWTQNDDGMDEYETIVLPGAPTNPQGDPRHYSFGGWIIKETKENTENPNVYGKPEWNNNSENIGDLFDMFYDNGGTGTELTMEAVWIPNIYSFQFNANYPGTQEVDDPDPLLIMEYNSNADIPNPNVEDNSYEFVGWVFDTTNITEDTIIPASTDKPVKDIVKALDKANADYLNKQGEAGISQAPDWYIPNNGGYLLTGVWKIKEYTVSYDLNLDALPQGEYTGEITSIDDVVVSYYKIDEETGEVELNPTDKTPLYGTVNLPGLEDTAHYTFDGWRVKELLPGLDSGAATHFGPGEREIIDLINEHGDSSPIAMEAVWTVSSRYDFRFNKNNNECTDEINDAFEVPYDGTLDIPKLSDTENYIFKGWMLNTEDKEVVVKPENCGADKSAKTIVDESEDQAEEWDEDPETANMGKTWIDGPNIILTALWEHKDCTETVNYVGIEKEADEFDVQFGTNLVEPEIDKDIVGYRFVGFYADEDCTEDFNFTGTVQSDVTIYAKYEEKKYDFIFDSNIGELTDIYVMPETLDDITDKVYTGTIDLSNTFADVYNNYQFVGWVLKNSEEPIFPANEEFNVKDIVDVASNIEGAILPDDGITDEATGAKAGNDSITLYALWQSSDYSVVFDPNADGDRELEGEMYPQNFFFGKEQALDQNKYTRYGYKFVGWATSPDGEKEFDDQQVITKNLTDEKDGVVILYAKWEKEYRARFYKGYQDDVNYDNPIPAKIVPIVLNGDLNLEFDPGELYTLPGYKLVAFDVLTDVEFDNETSDLIKFKRENDYPRLPVEDIVGGNITIGDVLTIAEQYADANKDLYLVAYWAPKDKFDINFVVNPNNLELTVKGNYPNYSNDFTRKVTYDDEFDDDAEDTPILYDTTEKYTFVGWAYEKNATEAEYDTVDEPMNYYKVIQKALGKYVNASEAGNDYVTLYAIWSEAVYAIWQDGDGNELYRAEIRPGANELPPYKGEIPEKENYDFEWDDPTRDNKGNTVIKAKFTPKKYTITWIDGNDVVIYTEQVAYGVKPEYDIANHGTPEKQPGGEATYEFDGTWSPEITEVSGDQEYVAQFTIYGNENGQGGNEEKVKYTITWIDGDGNEIYHEEVTEGDTPKYDVANHGTPEKQPGGFATYEFNGNWSPAIHAVTGDQEYVAQFDLIGPENGQEGQGGQGGQGGNDNPVIIPPTITYYTITWANYDGAGSTKTTQVEAGDRPTYNGTPAKADDAENTYTFIGWTPNITVATGDATYTALFTATKKDSNNNNPTPTVTPKPTSGPTRSRDYKINYYEKQADGTLVKLKKTLNPDTYTYGVGAEIKYGIDKEGYKFLGWYSQKTGKRVTKISKNSKGEKTLIAKFVPIDDGTGEGNGNGSGTPASEFGILFVRLVDYTANSMTLKWQPIEGVDGYDIFGSRCNSKDVIRPYEPIASVGADSSEYKMEGLLAKTYYKFYIRAYILVNKEKRYITTSINVHGVTLNDTYGVADEINIDKIVLKYINGKSKTKFDSATGSKSEDVINITLKVGQSLVLVSSEKSNTGKEIREHRPISFESSDPSVCVVGKKKNHKYGKEVASKDNTYKSHAITAVAVGECDINVFAQNGLYKKIHVTVKE